MPTENTIKNWIDEEIIKINENTYAFIMVLMKYLSIYSSCDIIPNENNSITLSYTNKDKILEINIGNDKNTIFIKGKPIAQSLFYKETYNNTIGLIEITNIAKLFYNDKIKFIENEIYANNLNFALFCGAFNPPTKAHNHIINKIASMTDYDYVVISASNKNFLEKKQRKTDKICYTEEQRERFLLELIFDNPKVLLYGVDDGYTYDVLCSIKEKYKHSMVSFICGDDKLEETTRWHKSKELRENFGFIILTRNETNIEKTDEIAKQIFKTYKIVISNQYANLSATKARAAIVQKENLNDFLNDRIINIIHKEKFYKI